MHSRRAHKLAWNWRHFRKDVDGYEWRCRKVVQRKNHPLNHGSRVCNKNVKGSGAYQGSTPFRISRIFQSSNVQPWLLPQTSAEFYYCRSGCSHHKLHIYIQLPSLKLQNFIRTQKSAWKFSCHLNLDDF